MHAPPFPNLRSVAATLSALLGVLPDMLRQLAVVEAEAQTMAAAGAAGGGGGGGARPGHQGQVRRWIMKAKPETAAAGGGGGGGARPDHQSQVRNFVEKESYSRLLLVELLPLLLLDQANWFS